MNKRLLSLFSGCGGMDLGFHGDFTINKKTIQNKNWIKNNSGNDVTLKRTEFDIVFANDIKPKAKIAWERYFQKHELDSGIYHVDSIVNLVKKHKKENVFPNNIDIVIGGFPCQDFSIAGKRLAFASHKSHEGELLDSYETPNIENRGELYIWMKEVIGIVKPKIFIAENVKGMKSIPNIVETIKTDFESIAGEEYIVLSPEVLHAGNFGVPQSRERIFFIGLQVSALKEEALSQYRGPICSNEYHPYPPKTHYINSTNGASSVYDPDSLSRFVSTKDVLSNLKEPWQSTDLSHKSRSRAKYYGNHMQGQIEVNPNELGPTIRAEHHGNIEFRRLNKKNGGKIDKERGLWQRRLSVRECARLQTFPDDYEFVINDLEETISMSTGYKLVGDAVPPVLAYNIAMRIQEFWPKIFKTN